MTAPGSGARRLGAVVIAAAVIASTVVARSTDWREVDPAVALLPDGLHVRDVRSAKVADTLRIFIGEPVDSQPSDRPAGDAKAASHPVIYVLDGNGAFLDVLLIARQLVETADVPPAVVVGIGYPVDSFQQTMNLRSRDYTPTADPELLAVANRTMWPGLPDAKAVTSGKAEAFLDFIQSELMPMIEGEPSGGWRSQRVRPNRTGRCALLVTSGAPRRLPQAPRGLQPTEASTVVRKEAVH